MATTTGPTQDVAPVPARHESKRERKRQLLQDRLQQMSESFSRGRDNAYREQLQKIQLDTTLIMRMDPYADNPGTTVDNDPAMLQLQNTDPVAARTLLEMAGPRFREWHQEMKDLVEERDYEISKQKVEFYSTLMKRSRRS